MVMRPSLVFICAALMLFVSACSGVQQTEGQPRSEPASPSPDATISLSAVETFDPTTYAVQPPQRRVEVSHGVPDRLMRGEASRGIRRTVEGFRIQIFSSQEKSIAERRLTDARDWWRQKQHEEGVPNELFPDRLPALIEYRPPYYRVRIGSFAEREQAEQALELVRPRYPDAFIARSTVTITR